MQKEQLILLAEKYLKGTATGTEQQQLHQWYDSWTDDEEQVLTVNVETSDTIKQRIFTCLQ